MVRKAICPVFSFDNVAFRELMGEHALKYEGSLLDSKHLALSDPLFNFQIVRRDANSHNGVLTLEIMADVVPLCERVWRLGAHIHLFRSVL